MTTGMMNHWMGGIQLPRGVSLWPRGVPLSIVPPVVGNSVAMIKALPVGKICKT